MRQYRSNRGYISVLVALFLVALAISVIAMFDAAQITTEKTRLQHVADSTAYSAAVMQARELNFHSYMNRAMVANQVAIGQMVSLSSYLQMNQQLWYELGVVGKFLQFIPYVGKLVQVATQIAEVTMGTINFIAQYAGSNFVQLSDIAIGFYSKASAIWHQAAIAEMALDLQDLVKLNDPAVDISIGSAMITGKDLKDWYGFIRSHNVSETEKPTVKTKTHHKKRLDEFRNVVLGSRDQFTSSRNQSFWKFHLGFAKIEFRQNGGSHFGSIPGKKHPYYSWSAVDTLSMWRKKIGWKKKWKETLPIGWGRQATVHQKPFSWNQTSQQTSWSGASTGNAEAYAMVRMRDHFKQGFFEGPQSKITHIGHFKVTESGYNQGFGKVTPQSPKGDIKGLRNFYDLRADNSQLASASPVITNSATKIHIFLSKPLNVTPTSESKAGLPNRNGPMALVPAGQKTASNDAMHAIAAGQAIFEKPWRHHTDKSRIELANLYSPYWQPKLVNNDKRTQALIASSSGDFFK